MFDSAETTFMTGIRIVFGKNLEAALRRRGWANSYLAQRVETSASNVTNWIAGKQFPRAEQIDKIAEVLGILPHSLFVEDAEIRRREIAVDDALLKIIDVAGYVPPKRLRKKELPR